jgi:predicted ArsR family transcriptional regulator
MKAKLSAVGVNAPGLGESRRSILAALKRSGGATVPVLADVVGLNIETVRAHLKALVSQGLVARRGTRTSGPGRPEVMYGLTADAESLFPRREAELLRDLASYLEDAGRSDVLEGFFDSWIEGRRAESLRRVEGLEGLARLREAARILTEQGFMATVEEEAGEPRLRLCHCPLRELVEVSTVPCRAEVRFVRELVGERLTRVSYIPAGAPACAYAMEGGSC